MSEFVLGSEWSVEFGKSNKGNLTQTNWIQALNCFFFNLLAVRWIIYFLTLSKFGGLKKKLRVCQDYVKKSQAFAWIKLIFLRFLPALLSYWLQIEICLRESDSFKSSIDLLAETERSKVSCQIRTSLFGPSSAVCE